MSTDWEKKKRATLLEIDAKWHVFYVQTRHEKVAAEQLLEDGFNVYLPLKKILKFYAQRKKWVEEPYIKSYLFIKINSSQLHEVLQYPKLISYIRFNNQPATIRDEHIDLIRKLVQSESSFNIEKKELVIGQKIQFESGPFKGHFGKIIEQRGAKKMMVQLDEFDHQIVIEM